MSFLQEDKLSHVLMYACRNCHYKEETTNPCVYKHDLLVVSNPDQISNVRDGTYTPSWTSTSGQGSNERAFKDEELILIVASLFIHAMAWSHPNSQHKEAVFFQGQAKRTDTKMTLFFVCTNCHKTFQDPILNRR
ncbi:BQ2448_5778 [Microbotryum intermedium]|uniref:DNA-directed RNA polymerase II subunit RPB9 n=1 Tax=Microbotryum intermedium TaxID=269621 RepID=A0A238EZ62_9BASI|nr:BQ2448_5778 [Microbotryum intermedium]